MSDIVERLRAGIGNGWPALANEAADEIEKLRGQVETLRELREFDCKEMQRLRLLVRDLDLHPDDDEVLRRALEPKP